MRVDLLVATVSIWAATRTPYAVAFDQAPAPPHAREGCCLLPKKLARVHLHAVFEGRFLIREPDFNILHDVVLAAQEERYQAGVWAVPLLADRVVAWLTAVVE